MSIYRLPRGQYGYSGHVINLPQDIPSFVQSLPCVPFDLDIVIVRKDDYNTHHDFHVRRSRILTALQWLVTNNIYFRNITIDYNNLSALPEDDHLTNIPTISSSDTNLESPNVSTQPTELSNSDLSTHPTESSNSNLSRTFIPSIHQTRTEQENLRESLQSPTTIPWPARGQHPLNEFQSEGYISQAFPVLFPTGAAEFLAAHLHDVSIAAYFKHLMLYDDGH